MVVLSKRQMRNSVNVLLCALSIAQLLLLANFAAFRVFQAVREADEWLTLCTVCPVGNSGRAF